MNGGRKRRTYKTRKTIQKEIIKKINVEQNEELANVDSGYVLYCDIVFFKFKGCS